MTRRPLRPLRAPVYVTRADADRWGSRLHDAIAQGDVHPVRAYAVHGRRWDEAAAWLDRTGYPRLPTGRPSDGSEQGWWESPTGRGIILRRDGHDRAVPDGHIIHGDGHGGIAICHPLEWADTRRPVPRRRRGHTS